MTDCATCKSDKRHEVETALVFGTPFRIIAKRFGLPAWSVYRHGRGHVSPAVKAAILTSRAPQDIDLPELQAAESAGLLLNLVGQRGRLQRLAELAIEVGNVGDATRVEGRITDNLKLVASLLGQLSTHSVVEHRNILISADYLALRQAIIRALVPFPEAAKAVGEALHRLETSAAEDITAKANGKALVIEHDPSEMAQ